MGGNPGPRKRSRVCSLSEMELDGIPRSRALSFPASAATCLPAHKVLTRSERHLLGLLKLTVVLAGGKGVFAKPPTWF